MPPLLPVPPRSRLAAVLEAGRRRLAIGWYRAKDGEWQPDGDLQNLTVEEFVETITAPILVCGELSGEARERLSQTKGIIPSPVQCVRRPAVLAELAWKRWQADDFDDPATLKPIYLAPWGAHTWMSVAVNMETKIRLMRVDDLPQVQAIDEISFSSPWPKNAYRYELLKNPNARCWVAEIGHEDCWADRLLVGT